MSSDQPLPPDQPPPPPAPAPPDSAADLSEARAELGRREVGAQDIATQSALASAREAMEEFERTSKIAGTDALNPVNRTLGHLPDPVFRMPQPILDVASIVIGDPWIAVGGHTALEGLKALADRGRDNSGAEEDFAESLRYWGLLTADPGRFGGQEFADLKSELAVSLVAEDRVSAHALADRMAGLARQHGWPT